ncbi:hypothetical protein GCM10022219_15290 [Microbacterium oryzae]|uniref:DUF8175 domain-containing protein n=1 Tax=Microbacterium oryzae TaxID=743009 RepID=A0A6I6E5V5_9MICO|nr:hypothetical protein [Microbacterium oryzae]QGU28157.1 hypothetical protein D7D94_11065 [Microbacterium oryzae]
MTSQDNEERSAFSRPGFVVAAVVVALIVVAGVVLGIVNATRDDPEPDASPTSAPSTAPSAAPSAEPSADAETASVCGLPGEERSGSLNTAPETAWEYQDVMAYPTSPAFGPAETSPDGVRFCFQHSVEGALFAAGNAVVQASSPETSAAWIEYFLSADAPNREELVSDVSSGASSDTRVGIAGFRVLAYDGDTARIDMALQAVGGGDTVYGSAVYDLVWEAGDWKLLPTDASNPLRIAQIPDAAGYVAWEE